jgi:arsenate reductase
MQSRAFNVLFLSSGNAARSLIAESLLTHRAAGRFRAYSAGSFPRQRPDQHAMELLERARLPTLNLRPKGWDEFAVAGAPEMDFIFTLCDQAAEQVCPVWPGQPITGRWSIPDPASGHGTELERTDAYREALRGLERRIELFTLLPFESLGRMALMHHVEQLASH